MTTIEDRLLAFAAVGRPPALDPPGLRTPSPRCSARPAPAYYRGLVSPVSGPGNSPACAPKRQRGLDRWAGPVAPARHHRWTSCRSAARRSSSTARCSPSAWAGCWSCDDVPTGRRVWERQVAGEDTLYVAGEWMFLISAEQEIGAINLADGRIAWVTPLPRWEDPDKTQGHPDLVWPVAGRRSPDRHRHQRGRAVASAPIRAKSWARSNCPSRPRRSLRSSPTARCCWSPTMPG